MLFYSTKSHNKIVHASHCPYLRRVNREDKGKFEDLDEAIGNGYRMCKCCSSISRHYRKEYNKIKKYACENGLVFYLENSTIIIQTRYSNWKIITKGAKKHMFLYHKNVYKNNSIKQAVQGYHSQSVRRNTILEYMEYIVDHDKYWLKNAKTSGPVYTEPARKGTKRYRKEKTKEQKNQRYQSVMRVLALIENNANYQQMQM